MSVVEHPDKENIFQSHDASIYFPLVNEKKLLQHGISPPFKHVVIRKSRRCGVNNKDPFPYCKRMHIG